MSEQLTPAYGDRLPPAPERICTTSDIANAQRFLQRFGKQVLYIHSHKQWAIWDGRRWREDTREEIHEYAKIIAMELYNDALTKEDQKLLRHAQKTNQVDGYKAMLQAARSSPAIAVTVHDLDHNPWLLNVQNGTIDLEKVEFKLSDPGDLITKLANVTVDKMAEAPIWEAFLNRIFGNNDRLIRYVQRAVGYSMTGLTNEQCFFMLYGTGANGKSTFLNVLSTLLGDYAQQTPFETILQKKYESDARSDLAALVGSRFVRASEGDKNRRLAESVVKLLTGEDSVTVRKLYGNFFTYRPEFKLWLATNHKPRIGGNDHGIWRRIRVIPFNVQIPDDERDKELEKKLLTELPGIFNWALYGLIQWREMGLGQIDEVTKANQEYQAQEDLLGEFIEERCTPNPLLQTTNRMLYEAFKEWLIQHGEAQRSNKWLSQQMIERGYHQDRSKDGRTWKGLGLNSIF